MANKNIAELSQELWRLATELCRRAREEQDPGGDDRIQQARALMDLAGGLLAVAINLLRPRWAPEVRGGPVVEGEKGDQLAWDANGWWVSMAFTQGQKLAGDHDWNMCWEKLGWGLYNVNSNGERIFCMEDLRADSDVYHGWPDPSKPLSCPWPDALESGVESRTAGKAGRSPAYGRRGPVDPPSPPRPLRRADILAALNDWLDRTPTPVLLSYLCVFERHSAGRC